MYRLLTWPQRLYGRNRALGVAAQLAQLAIVWGGVFAVVWFATR